MFHALAFSGRLSRQSFHHINEAGYVFFMIHIRLTLTVERFNSKCGTVCDLPLRISGARFAQPSKLCQLNIGILELRMKIAQIAPRVKSDPPRLSGGPERIVSYLTEGLVALGHDAVCQRRFDYECSIRGSTVPSVPRPLRLDPQVEDSIRC